jgi:hypothetical protein
MIAEFRKPLALSANLLKNASTPDPFRDAEIKGSGVEREMRL